MEFYEKLKVARKRAGLTQAKLAKITGITTRTIQNYELGASTPRTLEVLAKLSEVLGLTPSSLMGNSETSVAFEHEKGGRSLRKTEDYSVAFSAGIWYTL